MKKGFTNTPVILTLKGEGSRNGFTLMELLVYMMIVGIIVVVAGQAFSNSTKFRVRTQNMLKATQEAENVATLFKSDVGQMGAKNSKEETVAGGEDEFYGVCSGAAVSDCIPRDIYISSTAEVSSSSAGGSSSSYVEDLSSYRLSTSNGQSDLVFRRVRYGADGTYKAVEEINWFVDNNKTLRRSCHTVAGTADADVCPQENDATKIRNSAVEIATGVETFLVQPGIPSVKSNAAGVLNDQLFPDGTDVFKLLARVNDANHILALTSISDGGSTITISGFASNYKQDEEEIDINGLNKNEIYVGANNVAFDAWSKCQKFTLEPGLEYEISFTMSYGSLENSMLLFVAGRDHMAVGFRKQDGTKPAKLEDFLFYPPTNDNSQGKRVMRFTVPQQIADVCLAFTFATYSPVAASGAVTISNLKFRKVAGANYSFSGAALNTIDKKNVKAFKLNLQIGRGGKKDPTDNEQKPGETGEIEIVVPTPSNGVGI